MTAADPSGRMLGVHPPRPLRLIAGAAVLGLTALLLTGCSGAGAGGCTPRATHGDGSAAISAVGRFGTAPKVTFDTPLHVDTTEVSTLIPGSGAPIEAAQEIVADVTILNATTGALVTKSSYTGDSGATTFVVQEVPVPGLRKALVCAQVGERLATVLPPKEGLPAATRGAAISATDSVVVVADVRKAYLARADGVNQVMGSGLPAVVLGPDGRPGITLPEGSPTSALQVANLKKGSGAVITTGDTAVVQYTGVVWKPGDPANGTVFDSSWAKGAPANFPVKAGSLIPGFLKALTGQRVGSQVLAVIPPGQAYGNQGSGSVPAGATLVFVVDILGKA